MIIWTVHDSEGAAYALGVNIPLFGTCICGSALFLHMHNTTSSELRNPVP